MAINVVRATAWTAFLISFPKISNGAWRFASLGLGLHSGLPSGGCGSFGFKILSAARILSAEAIASGGFGVGFLTQMPTRPIKWLMPSTSWSISLCNTTTGIGSEVDVDDMVVELGVGCTDVVKAVVFEATGPGTAEFFVEEIVAYVFEEPQDDGCLGICPFDEEISLVLCAEVQDEEVLKGPSWEGGLWTDTCEDTDCDLMPDC